MFTYVELTNFKSFGKIKFNFQKKKKESKKFIAIYGENGSGKSNFVSALQLLPQTITSMVNTEIHAKIIQSLKDGIGETVDKNTDLNLLNNRLIDQLKEESISMDLNACRMIDNEEATEVKYGFIIKGVEGYYSIKFKDSIIGEELYYLVNKQRGKLFDIKQCGDKIEYNINDNLFKDKKYRDTIIEMIEMYWGKHSLLSFIYYEYANKNASYINKMVSNHLLDVLNNFIRIFILCKSSNTEHIGIISHSAFNVGRFENIRIKRDDNNKQNQLKIIETIIKDFYTQTYSDIEDVYYKPINPEDNDSYIQYTLYVKKMISGEYRILPFNLESAGTQNVLNVLRAILEAINGRTVIYDEIDSGIHDVLMNNILISVQEEITGQLIITTHNTLLLQEIDPQSAYTIYTDINGNKIALCMADFGKRIQKTNNAQKLYLNGVFGGLPYVDEIDYSHMHIDFSKDKEE